MAYRRSAPEAEAKVGRRQGPEVKPALGVHGRLQGRARQGVDQELFIGFQVSRYAQVRVRLYESFFDDHSGKGLRILGQTL